MIRSLLEKERVDVAGLTEVEISSDDASTFSVPGYVTVLPPVSKKGKVRTLMLVKKTLAVKPLTELMVIDSPQVWVNVAQKSL